MNKIEVKDLVVAIEGKTILNNISVTFEAGKKYAIVGPNGNGKSTLLSTIMGDPDFEVISGDILLNGESILEWEVDKRARSGIFLAMQYPSELAGVSNISFLNASRNAINGSSESIIRTLAVATETCNDLSIDTELIEREANVGFSGGEKKKNELLQMKLLKPKFSFLDEVDSGLDIDSIELIGKAISSIQSEENAFIIISHYKRLYELVKPDVVIVIKKGAVHKTGGQEILDQIFKEGFNEKN